MREPWIRSASARDLAGLREEFVGFLGALGPDLGALLFREGEDLGDAIAQLVPLGTPALQFLAGSLCLGGSAGGGLLGGVTGDFGVA